MDWLPAKPPANERIRKAWNRLYDSTFNYIRKTVVNQRVRELLWQTSAANLNVSILPRTDISEVDTRRPTDMRPTFYREEDESDAGWQPDDEQDQGNLMERDGAISAVEEHAVYMSFHLSETLIPHDVAQLYSFQRLTLHPDTAMEMIQSIGRVHRRAIAGALVHKFINANHRFERDEEYLDGDVMPDWRDLTNDPSLDALRFGNIPALYQQMIRRKQP